MRQEAIGGFEAKKRYGLTCVMSILKANLGLLYGKRKTKGSQGQSRKSSWHSCNHSVKGDSWWLTPEWWQGAWWKVIAFWIHIFKGEPLGFADRPYIEYKRESKQVQKYGLFYKFTEFLDTFRCLDRTCHVTSFNGRVQVTNPVVSLWRMDQLGLLSLEALFNRNYATGLAKFLSLYIKGRRACAFLASLHVLNSIHFTDEKKSLLICIILYHNLWCPLEKT